MNCPSLPFPVSPPLLPFPKEIYDLLCSEICTSLAWQHYWSLLCRDLTILTGLSHSCFSFPISFLCCQKKTLKRKSGRWKLQFTDEVLELPYSRKKSCSSACPLELSSDLHHPQIAVDAAFHLALSCCTHKCKMELVNHFLEKARDINVSTAEWVYVKMKSSWVA